MSQSLVSPFFFRCLDFRRLLLFSEANSLHSLLGCNWTSGRHQLTSVDWSQFSLCHHFDRDVATSMVLYDVATSSTHIDGQCRVGKCLKHAIRTTKPRKRAFYSVYLCFRILSLLDLVFNVL